MKHHERTNAVLHYQKYDRLPLVSFGYWDQTLQKWADEGYVAREDALNWCATQDNGPGDRNIMDALGFDFNWGSTLGGTGFLFPAFPETVLSVEADGTEVYTDESGHIQKRKPGIVSIPVDVGSLLTDRAAWEREYLPRLLYADARIDAQSMLETARLNGLKGLPTALHCGSLMGQVRNMLGVVEMSYLIADDETLFGDIVNTVADLCYRMVENTLKIGIRFDYAHFWEDICFKNGPLLSPQLFDDLVGRHYARITGLLRSHGIDIVSLDCDGKIDALIPTWVRNGVNTMFPIEVGTWGAELAPWRKKYGKELRGAGGVNKLVFDREFSDIDAEIERIKPLVDLGGYLPCPDHRIHPTAKYENVVYYCNKMRKAFG
ncbi:MAG: hypothetical protein FWG37_04405 [Clostridia bacterium]|nr:hypothetical protein [Clostridia bacterium]